MDLNSIAFLSMWLYAMFCKVTESLELTTTSRPPPVAVVLEQSLKAGKIKYGGDVPVIPVEDPSRGPQGENTCRRRSQRKYLGDRKRNCTSLKPLPYAWCEGLCFPQNILTKHPLKRYQEYLRKESASYECVADRVVRRKVKIFCEDDQSVTLYHIRVTKSCKCKQIPAANKKNEEQGSISDQAKRFSRHLHHLKNKLKIQ